jgi:hypothetical protein
VLMLILLGSFFSRPYLIEQKEKLLDGINGN